MEEEKYRGVPEEKYKKIYGEDKDSEGKTLSNLGEDQSSVSTNDIKSHADEIMNKSQLMQDLDIDADKKGSSKNSKETRRRLIQQRTLEEKEGSSKNKKDKKSSKSETKSKKSEKSEKSKKSKKSKKTKKSEKSAKSTRSEKEEEVEEKSVLSEVPEDIQEFVRDFKKNCIFLIRNMGIFQGLEAVLNGVKFNISKLDNFLVYAADMFQVENYIFTEKIRSSIGFGEATNPWTKEELKEYLFGFYD